MNFTDVQKFNYLKSQLESVATSTIEGFALTNVNYGRAIELLRQKFGENHKITNAYTYKPLLRFPPQTTHCQALGTTMMNSRHTFVG